MAFPTKLNLVQPLRGGLLKAMQAEVNPNETVVVSLEGGIGEALVMTEDRAILIKAGTFAGVPFGQKSFSFPYNELDEVSIGYCGG